MVIAQLISLAIAVAITNGQPVSQNTVDWDTYEFGTFTFPQDPSPTFAKGVVASNTTTYYAPHYTEVSSLIGNISTTTWGSWDRKSNVTATDSNDPYGNYAWTKLWEDASLAEFTATPIYSTTVEPTSVPSSSLILPPQDVFSFDDELKFPKGFVFGVAGSAAQIEGAIAEEGRGPSIQEKLVNSTTPNNFITNENYYLYKQDIARLAAMGVETYSFTIPWSRILPFAVKDSPVNKEGLDHYDDLINTCLKYGIQPMVTLTHFDTPLRYNQGNLKKNNLYKMQNGGYDNDTFVEDFVHYGKIVLTHFADRVPIWVSFNEPILYAANPTGIKHVIEAHAQLHKFYHDDLKASGKFGMKFSSGNAFPLDPANKEDVRAAKRYEEFTVESLALPLSVGKQQPDSYTQTFKNYSGLFTDDDIKQLAGTLDFFGIDPYTIVTATAPKGGIDACQANPNHELWPICIEQSSVLNDHWAVGYRSQSYVYITPEKIRQHFNYLYDTFQVPIFISEFGFPEWRESEKELKDQLFDQTRSIYYRSYMDAILKAIHFDKVQIVGATAWSFADNWEFGDYKQQFGLQVVNRTTQERYYKKSFFDLVKYYQDRKTE